MTSIDYLQGLCDGLFEALEAIENCSSHDIEIAMLEAEIREALEKAERKAEKYTILHFLEHDK